MNTIRALNVISFYNRKTIFVFVAIFTIFAYNPNAQASVTCNQYFKNYRFWSEDLISLKSKNLNQHLTYSYDTEILLGDIWGFIKKNGTESEVAHASILLNNIFIKNDYTLKSLSRDFKLSESQVRLFLINKNVSSSTTNFKASDFTPFGINLLADKIKIKNTASKFLDSAFLPIVRRMGLDIAVEVDGNSPEIKHATSEKSPKIYKDIIKKIHRLFKNPQTHFHVALPADFISHTQAQKIARAIEAKLVLELLLNAHTSDENLMYDNTVFSPLTHGKRGNIKLGLDTFTKPFKSHDLEIRQWISIDGALKSVEIASHLAKRTSEKNLILPNSVLSSAIESRYGAVFQSLDLVSHILRESYPDLSADLKKFSERSVLQSDSRLPDKLIQEISAYIRKNDIIKKYSEELLAL